MTLHHAHCYLPFLVNKNVMHEGRLYCQAFGETAPDGCTVSGIGETARNTHASTHWQVLEAPLHDRQEVREEGEDVWSDGGSDG